MRTFANTWAQSQPDYLHRAAGHAHVEMIQNDLFVGIVRLAIVFVAGYHFHRSHVGAVVAVCVCVRLPFLSGPPLWKELRKRRKKQRLSRCRFKKLISRALVHRRQRTINTGS